MANVNIHRTTRTISFLGSIGIAVLALQCSTTTTTTTNAFVSPTSVPKHSKQAFHSHRSTHDRSFQRSTSTSRTVNVNVNVNVPTRLALQPKDDDTSNGNGFNLQDVASSLPISSIILAIISLRSISQLLLPTEIPGCFLPSTVEESSAGVDVISTAFDVFFGGYGIQRLLLQAGILGKANQQTKEVTSRFAGSSCRLLLDIGREEGTWMPKDWGVSGRRLVLPVNLVFANTALDLGFPGEEALGGRYCQTLEIRGDEDTGTETFVSFVGPQGEVKIPVVGGGWSILPISGRTPEYGEFKIRFFLEFPNGAQRNDVSLPSGRVFFSGVVFDRKDANGPAPRLGRGERILERNEGGGKVGILDNGGLTITKNGITNLYGALGDTSLILGRFKVDKVY